VLFYDTRLSANNTTSCGSCHVQAHAFADPKPFSRGFHGALTDRRAMPLVNVRYYERAPFFWDERAGNLEKMVLLPIQSRIEMGRDLKPVVDTLGRDAMYPVAPRASPSAWRPTCRRTTCGRSFSGRLIVVAPDWTPRRAAVLQGTWARHRRPPA
jgi:hypothetical protein